MWHDCKKKSIISLRFFHFHLSGMRSAGIFSVPPAADTRVPAIAQDLVQMILDVLFPAGKDFRQLGK